ncbi:MAG: hypothetical protein ACJ8LN_14635 [Sulfurifustis sp.]
MTDEQIGALETFIAGYCDVVRAGFRKRWDQYTPEIYHNEISEAIGGLAARQYT